MSESTALGCADCGADVRLKRESVNGRTWLKCRCFQLFAGFRRASAGIPVAQQPGCWFDRSR